MKWTFLWGRKGQIHHNLKGLLLLFPLLLWEVIAQSLLAFNSIPTQRRVTDFSNVLTVRWPMKLAKMAFYSISKELLLGPPTIIVPTTGLLIAIKGQLKTTQFLRLDVLIRSVTFFHIYSLLVHFCLPIVIFWVDCERGLIDSWYF